jgi:D-alanyl-D-alanine carboxypeptidase-like protein
MACLAGAAVGDARPSAAAAGAPAARTAPPYAAYVSRIPPAQQQAMRRTSWHSGCPVPLSGLRRVIVRHWDWNGRSVTGTLIVGARVAQSVASVFGKLYALHYPVRRMVPVDVYGGSDFRSIEADNTSAFNCRSATGSSHWSMHAYGEAIDLNPIENPYLDGGQSSHAASAPYENRSRRLKGMVHAGDSVVSAFASVGWGWGGGWSGSIQDTQHFSSNGR